jgi:hypothetical protein
MPVGIQQFQQRQDKEESDLDKVIKGLNVAQSLFGIYGTYKNIDAAKQQQEIARQNQEMEKGKMRAAGLQQEETGQWTPIPGFESKKNQITAKDLFGGQDKLTYSTEGAPGQIGYDVEGLGKVYATPSQKGKDTEMETLRKEFLRSQIAGAQDKVGARREEKVNQATEKLSGKLQNAGEVNSALTSVEKKLGFNLDDYQEGAPVDLPGMSVPGLGRISAYDSKARGLQNSVARVFNAELKDRSGAAVTSNELERLKIEFGEGKFNTEEEMVAALKEYKSAFRELVKNIEAGFVPEAISTIEGRGGFSSKSISDGQGRFNAQRKGLSDLIQPKANAAPMSKAVDQMSDAEVMKAYQLKMSRGK